MAGLEPAIHEKDDVDTRTSLGMTAAAGCLGGNRPWFVTGRCFFAVPPLLSRCYRRWAKTGKVHGFI
jgi:hypothetical protein